jgi:hypothetical protein
VNSRTNIEVEVEVEEVVVVEEAEEEEAEAEENNKKISHGITLLVEIKSAMNTEEEDK